MYEYMHGSLGSEVGESVSNGKRIYIFTMLLCYEDHSNR